MELEDIVVVCHGCGVKVPLTESCSAYGLDWCSSDCLGPYREKQRAEKQHDENQSIQEVSSMDLEDIICAGCGAKVPQNKYYSAYGWSWCSTACIAPYRKEQQAKEAEKQRRGIRSSQGAFSMGGGEY
jgi:hypothetical protein